MQFPNDIQACLLFDTPVTDLESIVRTFMRVEQGRSGAVFNVPEAKPGIFYRLFGGDELMITVEYLAHPADIAVFQQPLASTITGIVCPDIRERITRSQSHILVNVSHGVLGTSPDIARLMAQIGRAPEGHSLPQFLRRLDVCGLLCRIIGDHATPRVVHWTQSNQLFAGETFDALAALPGPSPLHIHPYLFGQAQTRDGQPRVGIRTFGARHFTGRELLIEPHVLPWASNFETLLAFLRVATTANGYIIPHGDSFGPEDRSLSYRVLHREAEEGDVPLYELVPLMHREHGFVAPDYVPPDRQIDDRSPPPALMPADEDARFELVNEWREKRKLAEAIGGRFEVRSNQAMPGGATPGGVPPRPTFGRRVGFGRKQS